MYKLRVMEHRTAEQIVKRLLAHVEDGTTDYAPSLMRMGIERYFDDGIAAAEREHVFSRSPVIAAHASEVPTPGDFVSREYLGVPLLVIRQDDGSVRAFTNVCRHRGARLELEPAGRRKQFSCRYHRWCYGRDGALRSLPFDEGFSELDRSTSGLVALPTDERHGLVWAVLAPGPELDMGEVLGGELDGEMVAGGYGTARLYRERTFDLPMNWKFVMDGFLDSYHLQFLHPKTVGPFFHTNTYAYDDFGRNSRIVVARRSIDELRDAETADRNPLEYVITNYTIFPATVLAGEPDHIEAWTVLPHASDTNRCQVVLRFLVQKLPETDREIRYRDRNWDILLGAVENEDWAAAQSINDSLPRGYVPEVVLGRNELPAQRYYSRMQAELEAAVGSA
jgi:phenylpropionate dioxygenase-like ring-hydroxylating dioxygenase large terminal subunit